MPDHRARRRARQDILLRFRELSSWEDQYETYEVIQGYFFHSGRGSEALRELRGRAECVKALQRVAEHLGMAEGEAPAVEEYERARKELRMGLSAATIIRRWEVWREVAKAARGERVSMTARQRAHFHAAIKRKPAREEWLEGVREWLGSRPPTLQMRDYRAWAEERNESKAGLPLVPSAESIRMSLGIPWKTVVKVARRDISLADAQRLRLKALKAEGCGFVSTCAIALLHGVSTHQAKHLVKEKGFPAFAFKVYTQRVWHLRDIEAHMAGEPFPKRSQGEMQAQAMASKDVRELCGLTDEKLRDAVKRRLPIIPRPAGRVTGHHYWLRSAVEEWAAENSEHAPGLSSSAPMRGATAPPAAR